MTPPTATRASSPHTVGVIGQGRMGREHARAWSELGQEVRYICAPGPERAREHAASARFVTDLDVVLADPEVDIVSICTPTPTHEDIAIRALRAGKNVLLEKPIALTVGQALAIAAEARGTVLMVAHVVRFFAGYRALRHKAEAGQLGRILAVRARRISAPGEQAPWMRDESQSGGILVDFGIHDFDQLNLYLGTPVAVTAVRAWHDGPIETTVEYADGGIGQVLTHLSMPPGTPFTSSIELVGSDGLAHYRFSDASPTSIADENPYARQAEYFLHCVDTGTPPTLCPVDAAIWALRLALAAAASLTAATTIHP
ncbi:Gfo/Idh/MocA family oxidoreductase [Parafrigoribacterium mesophilum]|uniref:Gfo/Idh/MocA family protein n=1 Tax=Parafrigoribacterium mesophilum TaxID=433646 RepID=UPI0031FDA099